MALSVAVAVGDIGDEFVAKVAQRLPGLLPAGDYALEPEGIDAAEAALAWLLGSYRFDRYRTAPQKRARLAVPDGVDVEALSRIARAVALGDFDALHKGLLLAAHSVTFPEANR